MSDLQATVKQMILDGKSDQEIDTYISDFRAGKTEESSDELGLDMDFNMDFNTSTQDRTTQPSIIIPEIDPNAPLSARDFYNTNKKDDEIVEGGAPVFDDEEVNDFELPTATQATTSSFQQPVFDEKQIVKAKEKAEEEASLLKKWLNEEYFGKNLHLKAMDGSVTLSGYEEENKDFGGLIEDLHDKLGGRQSGIFGETVNMRNIFPNLSDTALKDIFNEVIDTRKRKELHDEQSADVHVKLNDIYAKKDPNIDDANAIEQEEDKIDWGVINSNGDSNEAKYAKITKLLKGELDDETRKKYEDALDPDILGSIGDLVLNQDETKLVDGVLTLTGKRIPKEKKPKIFHDVDNGVNVRVGKRDEIPSNAVDITDPYELYLSKFKNTSLDDLTKFKSQHLLEKSGHQIEGRQTGDYYIGDKSIQRALTDLGYKNEGFIFKDVRLKDIMMQSHKTHGFAAFLRPDYFMSKGNIIPQDFENKPYSNEQEFVEYLRVRRNQANDIAAKDAALWETYYLNRDPSTISPNRGTQFLGSFAEQLAGKQWTEENLPTWNKKVIDTFANQIRHESGVDIAGDPGKEEIDKKTGLVLEEQQADAFERTLTDDFIEGGAGISSILLVMHPVNKIDKAFKITQGILGAGRWVGMTGKGGKKIRDISHKEAVRRTALHNRTVVKTGAPSKTVTEWAAGAGYHHKKVSGWRKGMGIGGFALYEDFKMKEVLGTMTDGRMEFKRGVGAGFGLAPRLLPFGFGRFAQGKAYNLSTGSNRLNTFLQSTLVNGPSFALAVESGDVLGAAVDHYYGREEFKNWADHHWGDRSENMKRIGMNIFWGKALGMKNFNWKDVKSTASIKDFMYDSIVKHAEDLQAIEVQAKRHSMTPDQWIQKNLNHELVKNRDKHYEDWQMAQQRLDLINQTQKWVGNAVDVKKTYEEFYKPLEQKFKDKGKDIRIIATDAPVYQKIWKNGREVKQEVDALYTSFRDAKDGIAKIEINTKRSKGKETAIHESLHAYLDLMDIKVKKQVGESFRKALESITTPGNSNLYKDIAETFDIREGDKIEEMLAYSVQYMSRKQNYNSLTSSGAWGKIRNFWNNFSETATGKKADLNLKQDILNLMGTIAEGKIENIELLNEMIDYNPVLEGPAFGTMSRELATTNINKTIKQIKESKARVIEEINDLRSVNASEDEVQKKRDLYNELNNNQRKLENKVELKKVEETGWEQQIDRNYTIGKHKNQKDFQASGENRKIQGDILKSSGLINMINQGKTILGIKEKIKGEFLENVQFEIIKRFNKNYNPGEINAKYGRALTPFEYLTTGHKSGQSIIYRAIGDVAKKFKEQVSTISSDAYEGGYAAFEGYLEKTGHMNTARTFDSKVEREGIELSEQSGMRKKVGEKTLGEIIDQKSGADAKNLDFTAKGAKQVVSYKNIKPNAERTIGKEVTVDYYKVTPEMYKKMLKSESQQLNNDDITNILEVIKNDIEVEIKMMPLWKQSIIDKYTGQEVAFDIVGGKFPSEPKATGTTTKILKLGQEGTLEGLLYKEIPQTGTKGSKYEWSDRLKEYHDSIDKVFKKQFEQDVIEALLKGDRADKSGKLKGWMTQRKKAMYVQGVDKALPNTPELLKNFTLAEMANQIKAGKSPGIAATEINPLLKLIQRKDKSWSDMRRAIENQPGLEEAVKVLKEIEIEINNMTRNVDVVLANEKAERQHRGISEKEMQEQTIVAERFIKNVAEKEKLNLDYTDPKWVSKNDPAWREGYERQVYEEFGYDLKQMDLLKTHRKRQTVPGVMTALGAEFGFGNRNRKSHFENGTEAYLKLEDGQGKTIESILGIKTGGKGKDVSWMEKVFVPNYDAIKVKESQIETEGIKNNWSAQKIADKKIEMFREESSYTGKSKDYEATVEANNRFALELTTAKLKVAIKNKARRKNSKGKQIGSGLEWLLQDRAIQTNARSGVSKSLFYNVRSIPAFGSGPGEIITYNAKGKEIKKDNKGTRVHWEHALQLLNNTQFLLGIAKRNKSFSKKAEKELEMLMEASQQDLIPKNAQLFNDAAGNTMFSKEFGSKQGANLTNDALLNVFASANRFAKLENQYIVSGENKGKTLLDVQLETYNINAAKKIISSIPKKNWSLLEYMLDSKVKNSKAVETQNRKVLSQSLGKNMAKTVASKNINKIVKIVDKALDNGRKRDKKSRGMSTFDFDETLIIKGKNFVTATKGKESIKISSEKFPLEGPKLAEQGYKFDFKDFVNVKGGVKGPLIPKIKNQIAKYGNENVFVLTARMQESAPAIHAWLKSKGVEIPIKNITGLGNSTGEAKAMWMLEKFAEGYNDMYFVDDALPNVKAVKNILNQLDVKSKVQQALASTDVNKTINKIMEHSLDIDANKKFSKAEAKVRGKDIKRRRFFMSDSASDLELLIEPLYGKGKKGIENKKWLEKEFVRPFERGINDYNRARQAAKNDYMALRKQNKDVVKLISKEVEGTSFTNDMAMRVYLWNKAGYKIPDLAKTTEAKLVEHIRNNPKLQAYAEQFAKITKQEKGLKKPSDNWWGETMAGEITNINRGVSRKEFMKEWVDIKNGIFSVENLNKMESKLGSRWRENIEDMFDRMETGRSRALKLDRGSNMMISYLNGSAGTIMNFNTRSAFLQTISTLNFLNMRENNPIAAARAMGNVPQFSRDFLKIINSDMLRQRRDGLEINVTEAEIASAAASSKNPIQSIIAKVLKVGYTPTKLADSFAIAFGGATFYRNRIKMYEKQGMKTKEAEQKAWTDFQMLSERTQQSSRPDLLSKQQTSVVGRIVLPFANTPMQMNRRGIKEILDISKGRYKNNVELTEKMGRVTYYMGAQVALFAGLQSALFAMLFNDEDVTEDKIAKTKSYTLGTISDSFLRGMGISGAIVSGLKNATIEFFKQQEKGWNADYAEVAEDLLNISPLVGSKYGKLDWAGEKMKFNQDVPFRFELGNPKLEAALLTIESTTNAPVYSPYQNAINIQHGLSDDYEIWQRTHMFGGWSPFNVGIYTDKKKDGFEESFDVDNFDDGFDDDDF